MSVEIVRHQDPRAGFRLTAELTVCEGIDEVFAFFADAHQLERITPPWLRFRIETSEIGSMRVGTKIDYSLRLHGIPFRWQSLISEWSPPKLFVDEQLKGPYTFWRHVHTFEETESGTRVADVVDYDMPLRWLTHRAFVRRNLFSIFQYRHKVLSSVFTSSALPIEMGTAAAHAVQ